MGTPDDEERAAAVETAEAAAAAAAVAVFLGLALDDDAKTEGSCVGVEAPEGLALLVLTGVLVTEAAAVGAVLDAMGGLGSCWCC
jgi:hypothetical protein